MKTSAVATYHTKTISELLTLVTQTTKKLADALMQKKAGKYRGKRVSLLADELASIKTILRKKQLEEKV